jgi:hypothetical protein
MLDLWNWLVANYVQVALILGAIVALGEMIVKLTPTTTDDGFVTRVGQLVTWLLKLIGSSNTKPPAVK